MNAPQIKCPRCHKPTVFSKENIHRPFCSERCKLIDLGAWANEDFKIPVVHESQDNDEEHDPPEPSESSEDESLN